MVTKGLSTLRAKFLTGYWCNHSEEIEAARQLHTAIVATVGNRHAREIVKRDPVKLFRPLRYGRSLHDFGRSRSASIMIDFPRVTENRAAHWHILTPGHLEWRGFIDRVVRIQRKRDYLIDAQGKPVGLHGAAKAIDDMGFAIAESLAVLMLFRGFDDDDVVGRAKLVWTDGKDHEGYSNMTPAY